MDRMYKLIERCAIQMMPEYWEWMDGIEHETVDCDYPSGNKLWVLDLELEDNHRLAEWAEEELGLSDPETIEHQQKIDVLQRLVDLRDRKIRSDVPERREQRHPWCCQVWQLFRPEPPEDECYGDIPF